MKQGETVEMVAAELQELMLIDSRPDWRSWADELLNYNLIQSERSASDWELEGPESTEESSANEQLPAPLPQLFEAVDPYE